MAKKKKKKYSKLCELGSVVNLPIAVAYPGIQSLGRATLSINQYCSSITQLFFYFAIHNYLYKKENIWRKYIGNKLLKYRQCGISRMRIYFVCLFKGELRCAAQPMLNRFFFSPSCNLPLFAILLVNNNFYVKHFRKYAPFQPVGTDFRGTFFMWQLRYHCNVILGFSGVYNQIYFTLSCCKVVIDRKHIFEYGLCWKPPTLGIGKLTRTLISSHVMVLIVYSLSSRVQISA